ncbi:hypothetical protein DFS34DRAFT_590362 [Phlyctochytrium arcticum]|nr:hypothetical protein DFS34DRAFT_590362 [Phlyctochytrium arcticum]
MLLITSIVKILEISKQDNRILDVVLAFPTLDGDFIKLSASFWVTADRIGTPILDAMYFCDVAPIDATSSNLQVFTLHNLPDISEPGVAQVSVMGHITTSTTPTARRTAVWNRCPQAASQQGSLSNLSDAEVGTMDTTPSPSTSKAAASRCATGSGKKPVGQPRKTAIQSLPPVSDNDVIVATPVKRKVGRPRKVTNARNPIADPKGKHKVIELDEEEDTVFPSWLSSLYKYIFRNYYCSFSAPPLVITNRELTILDSLQLSSIPIPVLLPLLHCLSLTAFAAGIKGRSI